MASIDMLEIVDDNDVVIGLEQRGKIHTLGLRHREVWVLFITPTKHIILQRRSATKDTFPDMLDATAGGHVEPGQTYLEAAVREVEEETGITVAADELIPLVKLDHHEKDANGKLNNPFRYVYLYRFNGRAEDLRVETGKAVNFEDVALSSLTDVSNLQHEDVIKQFPDLWKRLAHYSF